MGGGQSQLQNKRVVIIGGGFAGAHAAHVLKGQCQLTLIDPREYLHFCVGSPRTIVDREFSKKIMVPFEPFLGESFKQGKVASLKPDEKAVVLESGEEIPYNYLIIATGSSAPFPGKLSLDANYENATRQYQDIYEKVRKSGKIVVIGGGAVGIEIAGEIATEYRDKEVILIHSGEELVGGPFKPMIKEGALNQLRKKGVKVMLGEKVTNLAELSFDGSQRSTVKTTKGSEIEADLVFMCTGINVNDGAYRETLSEKQDDKKFLKVNQYFQVEGFNDIFAIGDCCNIDQLKMAYLAEDHADFAVKNIKALANGGNLKPYSVRGGFPVIGLSIGHNGGVLQVGKLTFGSFFTKKLKSKSMFHQKGWETLGQKPPK